MLFDDATDYFVVNVFPVQHFVPESVCYSYDTGFGWVIANFSIVVRLDVAVAAEGASSSNCKQNKSNNINDLID